MKFSLEFFLLKKYFSWLTKVFSRFFASRSDSTGLFYGMTLVVNHVQRINSTSTGKNKLHSFGVIHQCPGIN